MFSPSPHTKYIAGRFPDGVSRNIPNVQNEVVAFLSYVRRVLCDGKSSHLSNNEMVRIPTSIFPCAQSSWNRLCSYAFSGPSAI